MTSNDRILNCGPYSTLVRPHDISLLKLAPLSSGGIVVSNDGTKQENAVYAAVQQIAHSFVPCCLDRMFLYNIDFHNTMSADDEFGFTPDVTALVPMIVTNATLYRLKPEITDLEAIRDASAPADIADEVAWTWYYHEVPMQLWHQNIAAIKAHTKKEAELIYRFPRVEQTMREFADRPNWIAVVNIKALETASSTIMERFLKLDTKDVTDLLSPRRKKGKSSS